MILCYDDCLYTLTMNEGKDMTDTLANLAIEVGTLLKKKGLVLTTAESCTGGGLSYWITSVDGSSEWFDQAFVTYSDSAKIDLIGVTPATLETYGAVSAETAREMAEGALKRNGADISIGITGIAGPTGGTSEKPVGTVWIAWASTHFSTVAEVNNFKGDRQAVREQSIERAMRKILELAG